MRNRYFLAIDALLCVAILFVAFTARFEGLSWIDTIPRVALAYGTLVIPLKLIGFWRVGLYGRLWKYASIADLEIATYASAWAVFISFVVGMGLVHVVTGARVPVGTLLTDSLLTAAGITVSRLILRMTYRRVRARRGNRSPLVGTSPVSERRVLIAGAGSAGAMIAKELIENRQLGLTPVGFLDDDRHKHGHHLYGLRVLGSMTDLKDLVRSQGVDEVITAIPSARGKVIREIMQSAADAGVRTRTIPALYEILSGAKAVSALRPIQIEDLLRREPIDTNLDQLGKLITGKVVLVTGAGGSIGRELCRQIAQLDPSQLVVVGRGENSIFELMQELRGTFPGTPIRPAIVDVRDEIRMRAVFEETRPFTVFHAAAHKHVPLMEASVDEAILNNVLGTRNVAELSAEYDVERMVLISTDKAVRPTSIMGATKRIAEECVCSVAERTGKPFVSVRFGNVLGSRGSVVPTFLRQIAAGGPITITHRDMRRYFMTIPEAVQLVLEAGAQGSGGEVFVLDMGEPVRITDLAEDLVRLSGLEVGADIEICYTGVRPGEKLYEELFFGPDDATPTPHPKILQARDASKPPGFEEVVDQLIESARRRITETELRRGIRALVPEYQPPGPGVEHSDTPPLGTPSVLEPLMLSDGGLSLGRRRNAAS
jgi:FlaA1/EpsC-like NDP-sugar epimerase